MALIRSGYVDTDEGQVHYRCLRGDGPPLVFLHHTANSSTMWEAVIKRSAGSYDMVALDIPGTGGSYDPEGMPSIGHHTGSAWRWS
ncbi:MAG: alpha/beta hydrolase [Spiribacter salinus]|uniref:Alpha/beta hydrolase n=1 Tax=Spiribacter salinus TaxID=1335746 RepID=A0A540VV28_9GAMM|nr:MAG: alpha/beta hydrolase [Spiribacter salinus]